MKFLLTSFIIFTSCLGFAKPEKCTYEFDTEKSKIEGTGFKYTEKTGVTANFPGFKLVKAAKAESMKKLLEALSVTVDLVTIDSGNALRDKNMRETLFTGILGDSVVTVTVNKVTDKKLETSVQLNEKKQNISFDYEIKKDTITAKGVLDGVKFALTDQLAALKKRCSSLHTGKDGKSVTWSDFAVSVTAKVKKTCQ